MKFLTLLICCIFLLASCATQLPLITNAGSRINTAKSDVQSMKTLREINIEMQKEDYSCGAASLATLMKHYFDADINEKIVLETVQQMFTEEEYKVIADNGLSFLELGQVSQVLGFQSAGVRLSPKALHKLRGPVLVYVETSEYKHFAVFRGIFDGFAYLADPSRGNIRLSMDTFLDEWKGQALVLGKKGFGVPQQHKLTIIESLPHDESVVFSQLENRLAPTQDQLLGDIHEF